MSSSIRSLHGFNRVRPDTITDYMGKFKPVRGKAKVEAPRAGWPCLVLLLLIMILTFMLIYYVLKAS